jgi:spermidine synthase
MPLSFADRGILLLTMSTRFLRALFSPKALMVWVSLIAILGGLTALGQQLLWTRRMVDILGGTAESASRVLGCFFLGLSLGAACAAWVGSRGIARPWRLLAGIEALIIVCGSGFFLLPPAIDWLWLQMGLEASVGWIGAIIKTLVSVLAVFPPAFLMGWFLPVAAQALRWDASAFGRKGLLLYGINTFGGVVGLVAISLLVLEQMGVMGAFSLLLLLHALCVVLFLCLDAGSGRVPSAQEMSAETNSSAPTTESVTARLLLFIAFFSGFAVLAAEVVALKIILLVAPLSFHAPAIVLTVVILLLAIAAWVAVRIRNCPHALSQSLWLAAVATVIAPFAFYLLAKWSGGLPAADSFTFYWFRLFGLVLLAFGPGFFFAGLVFPLISAAWSRHTRVWQNRSGGHAWGWLLAVNGLGGLLGAEFAYRILLPQAGIYQSMGWIALAYAIVCISCLPALRFGQLKPLARNLNFITVGTIALVAIFLLPKLPTINPYLPVQLLWQRSGADGTVAVVEFQDGDRAILVSNQYFLGSVSGRYSQERQGHLPLLLHPRPISVGFLGVATGMTPAAAVIQQAPQSVEAFEISRSVLSVSERFFADYNQALATQSNVRLVREDARLAMTASSDRYDVIIGDLFLPWGPGEARLFTREHFAAVHDSLRQDGLFAQWLPLYQLSESHLSSIVASMRTAFPEIHFFLGKLTTGDPILALIGWRDGGQPDWQVVRKRVEEERPQLSDPLLRHAAGIRLMYLGNELSLASAPVNTLNNVYLELSASRDRIVGGEKHYLSGAAFMHWLEQQPTVGGFYPSLRLLRWQSEHPDRSQLSDFSRQWIPADILNDESADWRAWPGPVPAGLRLD